MKRIVASRGMGKTSRLISEAKQALRNNKKVIFITPTKYLQDRLQSELPEVEFMTIGEAVLKSHGRQFNNTEILVDDIDMCIARIFGTSDFTYTLSLGDEL